MRTMARGKLRPTLAEVKALLAADQDFLRPRVAAVLQELLEAEMTAALGAAKGERTAARRGHRSGSDGRTLVTRVGQRALRVPQGTAGPGLDRAVRARSTLGEGAGGGAGRDVRPGRVDAQGQGDHRASGCQRRPWWSARSGALCGHSFSAAAIGAINARLGDPRPRGRDA
jgi:hypothetical protein